MWIKCVASKGNVSGSACKFETKRAALLFRTRTINRDASIPKCEITPKCAPNHQCEYHTLTCEYDSAFKRSSRNEFAVSIPSGGARVHRTSAISASFLAFAPVVCGLSTAKFSWSGLFFPDRILRGCAVGGAASDSVPLHRTESQHRFSEHDSQSSE